MSSGAKGVASRVSIPSGVKKTIDNIKEITGQNHSEDEIYAMLKECSMDPNETAQRLLLLDTFHEVKRKRDKRKEKLNKEPTELKWKAGTQARPSRGGHGNYTPRFVSPGGGRNSAAAKENASCYLVEKGSKAQVVTPKDMRKNETSIVASSITAVSNGPSGITAESANAVHNNHASAGGDVNQSITISGTSGPEGSLLLSSSADSIKSSITLEIKDMQQHRMLELRDSAVSVPFGSSLSSADPTIVSSANVPFPSAVGTICHEVESQHGTAELINNNPTGGKSASVKIASSESEVPNLKQKMPNDNPVVENSQHVESVQTASSTGSRPSSNYNNRSQIVGLPKVGHGKEWKPKSSNVNAGQGVTIASAAVESHSESQTAPVDLISKEDILDLQRKLESSHISDSQHVIIPNHLHVHEVEKLGFCFGSFDASFGLDMNQSGVPVSDKSPPLSESSEAHDEPVKESQFSNQDVLVPAEDVEMKYPDQTLSPSQGPDKFPSDEVEETPSVIPNYSESKPEVTVGSNHHFAVNTSSNPNYGVTPPVLGGHVTPLETSESQAHDAPRLPSFIVPGPQSYDPASYYPQFYRLGMDGDGRISPFHLAGAANKYNGNAAVISAQTSQTPQEGGAHHIFSTASTPLVTQAAGLMQSTISAAQQPLPVFRQPAGVHLAHYPPNYIPYGPYFPQFYVTPPAMHSFLSNGAFPQQPQAGSLYPTAAGTATKYSASQYKQQGSGTGSSAHLGVPGSYGPYGLSMANYTSGSSTAAVTTTFNEDDAPSQNKENNVYAGGQPNEGSGMWFTTPGRDISTLQTNSFYNLPPGQLAFTPTQPGHGSFTGIFHPAQAMTTGNVHPFLQQSQSITNAADMVGPTSDVYQQPQHAQLNWPSNYQVNASFSRYVPDPRQDLIVEKEI